MTDLVKERDAQLTLKFVGVVGEASKVEPVQRDRRWQGAPSVFPAALMNSATGKAAKQLEGVGVRKFGEHIVARKFVDEDGHARKVGAKAGMHRLQDGLADGFDRFVVERDRHRKRIGVGERRGHVVARGAGKVVRTFSKPGPQATRHGVARIDAQRGGHQDTTRRIVEVCDSEIRHAHIRVHMVWVELHGGLERLDRLIVFPNRKQRRTQKKATLGVGLLPMGLLCQAKGLVGIAAVQGGVHRATQCLDGACHYRFTGFNATERVNGWSATVTIV